MPENGIIPLKLWAGDEYLEESLSWWYLRSCSVKYEGEPLIEGEWGGSVNYMKAKKDSEKNRIKLYIDFGSINDIKRAAASLRDHIEAGGYRVVRGIIGPGCIFLEKADGETIELQIDSLY